MLNDQMRAASVPAGELRAAGATRGGMTTEGAIRWRPISIPRERQAHQARNANLDRGSRRFWTPAAESTTNPIRRTLSDGAVTMRALAQARGPTRAG